LHGEGVESSRGCTSEGTLLDFARMGAEVHLWQVVASEQLNEIVPARLDLESRLQEWLARDISILDAALLVIGREVPTDFGGSIDILCVDAEGDLVIVELKRNRTPREVTAQAIDYASWVTSLSNDRVSAIAGNYLTEDFGDVFRAKFGVELPETLNEGHQILVVGSEIDSSSERIISYLSNEHGVNINAATFQYFQQPDGPELLARVFLLDPSEVVLKTRTQGASKRRPILTYEELRAIADEAGVAELYDYAFDAFQAVLYIQRKQASIGFVAAFDYGRRVVLSLVPGESSRENGLRFQLYKTWFAERARISPTDVGQLIPQQHEDWSNVGEDLGFQGFITRREEIDRLASALRKGAGGS
jgi:hypothetical protein